MKHGNALELSNVSIFVIMDLLHLIAINNKKQGVGLKIGSNHFDHMMHQGPVS
jgi:hypothetical protein